jgi:hypothetical protein
VVSTNAAVMERRLAAIPLEEWGNLAVDLTPKDAVLCRSQHNTCYVEQRIMPSRLPDHLPRLTMRRYLLSITLAG